MSSPEREPRGGRAGVEAGGGAGESARAASPEIVVVGANGVVGQRVVGELVRANANVSICVRGTPVIDELPVRTDFAGAAVVVNCTSPLRDTAADILVAAVEAGAHYVDAGGEQAVMHALYQQHESTVRHAGVIALPGAGLDCVVGDLAARWAAEHVCGASEAGSAVRTEPAPRVAAGDPLDDIAVSYVFDDLALSAGSQRALFGSAFARPLVWRRDRWEAGRAGERRAVNAGPALGGPRDAIAYPASDALVIPRHVDARFVATYASTTRRAAAAGAMRLLARALPLVPRAASELLAPYAAPDTDYTRTQLAVIAQVRRGFAAAQVVVRGHDLYRTTAAITAWCARSIAMRSQVGASRASGPIGMLAPGELFHAAPALRELASLAGLTIEPSWAA